MIHKKLLLAVLSVILVGIDGEATAASQKQVTGLTARHASGETMLTWHEVDSPATAPAIAAVRLREMCREWLQERFEQLDAGIRFDDLTGTGERVDG